MAHNDIHRQIMREYERDRLAADVLYLKRKAEAYNAMPRLKEIDEALVAHGLSISRLILAGEAAGIAALKERVNSLNDEKRKLICAHGLSEGFLADVYKCPHCKDTGYIDGQKCRCLTQRLVERYYSAANTGGALDNENFDTFDFRYYSEERDKSEGVSPRENIQIIYKRCLDFTANFGQNFENLLFHGDTGLGKTFLCNCIAKEILERGKTVLYLTAPQIFKKVEAFRFNRDEMEAPDEQMAMLYDVDLLIIDDLGSEFVTSVTKAELFNIINSRLLEKKPSIISTNLSFNDFHGIYSDRIVSRMLGHYKTMMFFGDDIRVKKKQKKSFSNR